MFAKTPKEAEKVFLDLLLNLTFRCRPYEEMPGEIEKLANNLEKESAQILPRVSATDFYALCDRAIATFETRSLIHDLAKPRVGILQTFCSERERKSLAKVAEKCGAEAVIIGETESLLLNQYSRSLLRIWKPIWKMLEKSDRFLHLAYNKSFWKEKPTLQAYYEHQGARNFCMAKEVTQLKSDTLLINNQLAEHVKPHARTHAPNLCATHFSLSEPIQLSQDQMAMIEEAKKEAKERNKHGV